MKKLPLYKRYKKEPIKETLVDNDTYKWANKFKWNGGSTYPNTVIENKQVFLHRLIMGNPLKGKVVDHINRNPLDNRKKNLRIVTQSENVINSRLLSRNKTGIKGVSYHIGKNKKTGYYIADIYHYSIRERKLFHNLEDAIKCRKEMENKYGFDKVLGRG